MRPAHAAALLHDDPDVKATWRAMGFLFTSEEVCVLYPLLHRAAAAYRVQQQGCIFYLGAAPSELHAPVPAVSKNQI